MIVILFFQDDDEDGDMYEAPPCERTVKVPQRQVEENVYLGKLITCHLPTVIFIVV